MSKKLDRLNDKANAIIDARLNETKAENPGIAADIAKDLHKAYDATTGENSSRRMRLAGFLFARAILESRLSGKKRHRRHLKACEKLANLCVDFQAAKSSSNPSKKSRKKRKNLKARIRKGTRKLRAHERKLFGGTPGEAITT